MLDMVTPYYLTLLGSPWSLLRPGYGPVPEEPQMEVLHSLMARRCTFPLRIEGVIYCVLMRGRDWS